MTIEQTSALALLEAQSVGFSIGAVVVTALDPETARVGTITSPSEYTDNPWGITNFSTLMRETPDAGESADEALHRGLQEELRVRGTIVTCLGAVCCPVVRNGLMYPKATLYRLVLLEEAAPPAPHCDEVDQHLRVEWLPIREALARQQDQAPRMHAVGRPDLDEQRPLQRALDYLMQRPFSTPSRQGR